MLTRSWDHKVTVFANKQYSYGPWLLSKFHFCSITFEQIDGILSNFTYALTLISSRWIVTGHFLKIYSTIMALDYLMNFVSA